MSLKSSLALRIGLKDTDSFFLKLYAFSFEIQRLLDRDTERRQTLKLIRPYTHVNYARLTFLWDAVQDCIENKKEGAFVETGVWRGGCAGIMAYLSKKYQYPNDLYFFDSFEGLPQPSEKDGRDAIMFAGNQKDGTLKSINKVVSDEQYLEKLFDQVLEIDTQHVHIHKGWFQDTLPKMHVKIGKIALLRLDGDWYESTKVALEYLYPHVIPGG
ncbi:class I SAM-dependent methyltransferase, partial [candidate division WWE3 bacterium]|nr:class I SAM-dependent methyltransferase [candidate division WWE3 bacterium]